MIELGKMQKLIIVRKEKFGVYVGESAEAGPEEGAPDAAAETDGEEGTQE